MKLSNDKSVLFAMVGGTEDEILFLKQEFDIMNNVVFIPRRPYREIPFYLKSADVLVLPNERGDVISEKYTSPLKMFEYMASKTNIIASDLRSIKEVLNFNNSIFFEPGNASDLNRKIDYLLESKNQFSYLVENAYNEVKNYDQCGIYYSPAKQARINKKRVRSVRRKKITDLTKKPMTGFLVCVDTVVRYVNGQKRYILTAIDRYSKLSFARMYTTHSSKNAADFLHRLHYLLDGKIENIQTDNGSEFKKCFDQALTRLEIPHYHSRVKTPKDNAVNERFNRTLNKVLPMYPSSTEIVARK
ncbi:DDE-type integrase/transposase/recombinase [Patescibacteria group bacterium]|nr:DDE-type integrase/transposase/recombinase [Patescibacteria group bacterium]